MLKFCIKFNDFIITLSVDFTIGYVYKNIGEILISTNNKQTNENKDKLKIKRVNVLMQKYCL